MDSYWKKQLAIVACLYFGEISVGYVTWSSPVIVKLQDPDQTPLSDVISDGQGSWVGAASLPGVILGATLSGWFSNTFGRKPSLLLGGIFNMASYLLLGTADQFWMVIVGRTLNGAGIGIILVMNMTYIAEISSTNIRGILLTVLGFFVCLGMLLAFVVGPFFSYMGVMYMGFFLAMMFSVGTLFIPETPSFLVLKGMEIEAKRTLVELGRSDDIEEVLSLKPLIVKSRIQGLKDVIFIRSNRKGFLISLVLFICQAMSGHAPVLLFVTTIFRSVNSSIDPGMATIIVGVMQLLSSCVTPLFVERGGRKMLLIYSTAGCSLSMGVLGVFFFLQNAGHASASWLHWIPLASITVFLISYHSGYHTIPAAYSNEMLDSSARGPGSSVVFSAGAIVCFMIAASFGYLTSTVGSHVPFLTFAGASACCCAFSAVFVVETKGKSLAEVQLLLNK